MTALEFTTPPAIIVVMPVPFGTTTQPVELSPGLKALKLAIETTRYGHMFCIAHVVGVYPA